MVEGCLNEYNIWSRPKAFVTGRTGANKEFTIKTIKKGQV